MSSPRRAVWWNVHRFFHWKRSRLAEQILPGGRGSFDRAAYDAKLRNVASALVAAAGKEPALVGLSEVENRAVIRDLLRATGWRHLDVADDDDDKLDGYDLVLLYDRRVFELEGGPRSFNVHNRFNTRDIFWVPLRTPSGGRFDVVLNHWPSRSYPSSEALRIGLADYCARLVNDAVKLDPDELYRRRRLPARAVLEARWNRPVLLMGDFNDEPFSPSVLQMMNATPDASALRASPRFPRSSSKSARERYLALRPRLFNPMWALLAGAEGRACGTMHWQGRWYMLDQLLLSRGLLEGDDVRYVPESLRIFEPHTVPSLDDGRRVGLTTSRGRPRAFDASRRTGASDHLMLTFELEI